MEIRQAVREGVSLRQLAEDLGVSETCIRQVAYGDRSKACVEHRGKHDYKCNRCRWRLDAQTRPTLEDLCWKRVDWQRQDGCWLWTGTLLSSGAPKRLMHLIRGEKEPVRVIRKMALGCRECPPVKNQCGVLHCVNPAHWS